ncbi:MAG: signal peptidase I [Alkalispirochaeta sp.]
MQHISARLVRITEILLTRRLRRKARHHLKQSRKHVVVDWIEAFLQAAFLVLIINQYLLQAYQIPSGSMIDTLLLGDRIFVNKVVYGPELLPGIVKLPGFSEPKRNEVMIFENPSYLSRGTAFTILQRTLYMLTLSLVDIDRDESGQPRAQLLIKRSVGVGGDRFRTRAGDLEIRPAGAPQWLPEGEFIARLPGGYDPERLLDDNDYDVIRAGAVALSRRDLGLPSNSKDSEAVNELQRLGFGDPFAVERYREGHTYAAHAHDGRARRRVQFIRVGWYVPEGRILPVGDNRDNSRDGRYFGPVRKHDVLGRAMMIYWPFDRAGAIR